MSDQDRHALVEKRGARLSKPLLGGLHCNTRHRASGVLYIIPRLNFKFQRASDRDAAVAVQRQTATRSGRWTAAAVPPFVVT